MKRMQLFEFEDFAWFPNFLRKPMTTYLANLHRLLGTPEVIAPLLLKLLQEEGTQQVVDLCSGSGGAMPTVGRMLRDQHKIPVRITLTDLYPNETLARSINSGSEDWLRYETKAVDAGRVEGMKGGVRSMVGSFHHMPPTVAKKILADAFHQRQALFIFELSDNSAPKALWWLSFPVGIPLVLILTPLVRPFTFKQFFLTYLLPLMPVLISWDGCTSNARTYTEDDLREMLQDLQAPDYTWTIGRTKSPKAPGHMLYLIGQNSASKA